MSDRLMMHVSGAVQPLSFGYQQAGAGSLVRRAPAEWGGLPVEVHRMQGWEGNVEAGPLDGERGLMVYLSGSIEFMMRVGSREITHRRTAGCVSLMSGAQRRRVSRMVGEADVAIIHLPSEWFGRVLCETVPPVFERSMSLGAHPTLLSLTHTLCDEIANGAPTGRLFAESVSVALLKYAVHHIQDSGATAQRRGLAPTQCRLLTRYIDERLPEELSLPQLAAVVGLKPRGFLTQFSRAFGVTPYRYVVNRRLEEGARQLTSGVASIAEVAYGLGFSSQSHFTAAFRQCYGVTPRQFAQRGRKRFTASDDEPATPSPLPRRR